MSTRAQLRAKIDRRTGHFLTEDALNDLINEALAAISLEARWPWLDELETVASWPADTETHTMDADWQTIKSITVGGVPYSPVSSRDVDAADGLGGPGWTYGFSVSGSEITLVPAPAEGALVEIRGTRNEPELDADGDSPLMPASYESAIVHYACGLAFDRHHDQGRRETHMNEYDRWVKRMKRGAQQQASGPRVPRVRPGGAW